MENSPTTAACQLEPVCIFIFFTIFTWSISMLQRFLPGGCQSCNCPVSKTTPTLVLADRKICKALNKNNQDEKELMFADAYCVMGTLGLSFDHGSLVSFQTTGSDCISQLFDDNEPSLQEVERAFFVFDENNDGYIDASDLQRVLKKLGFGEGVGVNECEKMIARYDTNKDRRIDMTEFTKVLEDSFC